MSPRRLPGRFSGSSQTEVRRTPAVGRLGFSALLCTFTPACDLGGVSRRGKTLPRSSSERPPRVGKKKGRAAGARRRRRRRRMIMGVKAVKRT